VGTDTRRLSVMSIENTSPNEISIIIPKKAIIEIQKLFINQIEIYYDQTNLIIKNENYFFFTRLIMEFQLPNIPKSFSKYQTECNVSR